jgi:hypothetical protein
VYTTCEAGKRRTVNHTRARSLASPSRAVAMAEARCGARVRVERLDATARSLNDYFIYFPA